MARNTLEAFLRGFIEAIPTGKQNTFASPTETSLALVVVREAGALSLANAFAKPVQPKNGEGLIELSIEALDEHFGALRKLYGEWAGVTKIAVCTSRPNHLKTFKEDERVDSLPELARRAVEAAFPHDRQEEKVS
jgi:CRISPR system Cascade subunit CasC